jgi:small subunit ribosomal protein S16
LKGAGEKTMAVRLRFQRLGRPQHPFFRLVVVDSRGKRDGSVIERLGNYNPKTKEFKFNEEKVKLWLSRGVIPSETVNNLLKKHLLQSKSQDRLDEKEKPASVPKT